MKDNLWYRLHRLVNLDQGDEQEASPDFMGPEAYETAEFLQKLISCIKEGPKMAGRGPETLHAEHNEIWTRKRRGFLSCISLY